MNVREKRQYKLTKLAGHYKIFDLGLNFQKKKKKNPKWIIFAILNVLHYYQMYFDNLEFQQNVNDCGEMV